MILYAIAQAIVLYRHRNQTYVTLKNLSGQELTDVRLITSGLGDPNRSQLPPLTPKEVRTVRVYPDITQYVRLFYRDRDHRQYSIADYYVIGGTGFTIMPTSVVIDGVATSTVSPSFSVTEFVQALQDPSPAVRHGVFGYIQTCSGLPATAVPLMTKALLEIEGSNKIDGILCLGEMGPRAHGAEQALITLLRGDPSSVGDAAAEALELIDSTDAAPEVEKYWARRGPARSPRL